MDNVQLKYTGYISHIRGMYACGSSLVYVYQTVRQTEADRKTRGTGTGTNIRHMHVPLVRLETQLGQNLSYCKNALGTYLLCMGTAPKY